MKRIALILLSFLALKQANAQISTANREVGAGGGPGMGKLGNFNFNGGGQGMKTDSLGRVKSDWDDTPAKVIFRTTYSDVARKVDSNLHQFHKRNTVYPIWGRTLGNDNSAGYNMFFTPNTRIGLQSGFTAFDIYQFPIDSLRFYKTDKPYSEFDFMMGPKRQQDVGIMHTQSPNDQFTIVGAVKGGLSQGFYSRQTTRHMRIALNAGYQSKDSRYALKAGFLYQRHFQDEHAGIMGDEYLGNPRYTNYLVIPVGANSNNFSNNRSAISNSLTNTTVFLHHQYAAWGVRDTLYNEDSTTITPIYTPRFTLMHKLEANVQQHLYKDVNPKDSLYMNVYDFTPIFLSKDSVYAKQNWNYLDNKFAIGTSIGQFEQNVNVEAGVGVKLDRFANAYMADSATGTLGIQHQSYLGTYLYGKLVKEAYNEKQWYYDADAQLYLTGPAAGNFALNARVGKIIKSLLLLQAGLQQSLSMTPHFSANFITNKYQYATALDNQNVTAVWGNIAFPKYQASIAVKNQLLTNYIYYDKNLQLVQDDNTYNILQVNARKDFKLGRFRMHNEAIWQQIPDQAPINMPQLMLRHQLGVEAPMFKSKLAIAVGLEVFYHTAYKGMGYSPMINQFYYQNEYEINNKPELGAYFNFKVKTFRAFLKFDQLQSLWWKQNVYAQGYASQGLGFRFGFNWPLSN